MISGGLQIKGIEKKSTLGKPLITVVTVVYNGATTLEQTIQSVVNQSYDNKEYIIIDGASTDGTLDIIKKYEEKIDYWQSEPDNGIYDAMNKGINIASGEWINFLNCGDLFCSDKVLESLATQLKKSEADVVYGNSIEENDICFKYNYAEANIDDLSKYPIYRHGASFVRTSVHKKNLFDLSKKKYLGYSLDYNCIFNLYNNGYTFEYVNQFIQKYEAEGVSANPLKTQKYIFRITKPMSVRNRTIFLIKRIKLIFTLSIKKIKPLKYFLIYSFEFLTYFYNFFLGKLPFYITRRGVLFLLGVRVGKKTRINMGQYLMLNPSEKIHIGNNCHINHGCFIDARGGLKIGNNVSISHNVTINTASHDINNDQFKMKFARVKIEDNVWIGINATILQGVTIGKGAVIAAGAIVTKDVAPYTVVAGIPAKKILDRNMNCCYRIKCDSLFL